MSYREVIGLARPSIVRLVTSGRSGSGFIIRALDNSAYVATNRHVVEGAEGTIRAIVGDATIHPGVVAGEDDRYDFAIVWICCSDTFKALPLAEDGSYSPRDEIGAFGYPLNAEVMQVTWGNFHRLESQPDENGWDMKNRPLNTTNGNSGGPLLNLKGQVMGIHAGSVSNEPFANGVSARAVAERLPLLSGGHTPDERTWPAVNWRDGVSVSHDGLLKLDVNILQSSFAACDNNTRVGTACKPNVVVYRNGTFYRAVYGYRCSAWCIDSSSEKHLFYPTSGRLEVKVLTGLSAPGGSSRWDVCIHSNIPEHPLLGCSPIQWESR